MQKKGRACILSYLIIYLALFIYPGIPVDAGDLEQGTVRCTEPPLSEVDVLWGVDVYSHNFGYEIA